MSRTWLGGVALLVSLGLLLGCSEQVKEATIEVEGPLLTEPTITYTPPFDIPATKSSLIVEGQGERLVSDEPVLLHYRLESAATGELIDQTFGGLPKTYLLVPEEMSLELYDALVGLRVGSRMLLQTPGDEAAGTVPSVLVADILSTEAEGNPVEPREGLPVVHVDDEGVPQVEIPEGDPPGEIEVQTLIRGSGAQITSESTVVVQYTMVRWSDSTIVDSTWDALGPRAFSLAEALTGWTLGLAEQTVGSRVLLVVPPRAAFGEEPGHDLSGETIVYVVDILAATTPEED